MSASGLENTHESQFVSFKLGTEEYGLNINNVQEIIKVSSITKVPRAPYAVEGVVNLRGNILPIVDARKRFDMDSVDVMDSSRIIVTNYRDMNVGLVVDSVSEVIRIEPSRIEPPPPILFGSNDDYISGIGKLEQGKRLISILDLENVLEIDSLKMDYEKVVEGKYVDSHLQEEEHLARELQMVSFQLGTEEYAIDINKVDEIIRIPEITSIPNVPGHIKGVICLRGNVLPVIGLRYLFGMEETDFSKRSRILIVKLQDQTETADFGIIVDNVNEVISVPRANIESPPGVLANETSNIEGIGKLNRGSRMILILNPGAILDGAYGFNPSASSGGTSSDSLQEQEERALLDEQQLVSLRIGDEEYGINIMNVQEIIRLGKITSVPGAPDYVRGVVNLRGNVLPVIEMRARFGLDSIDLGDSNRIMVVNFNGKSTGLIVDSVSEVLQIPNKDIEPPPEVVSDDRGRFIEGVGKLEQGERFIIILNIGEILGFSSSTEDSSDDFEDFENTSSVEPPSLKKTPEISNFPVEEPEHPTISDEEMMNTLDLMEEEPEMDPEEDMAFPDEEVSDDEEEMGETDESADMGELEELFADDVNEVESEDESPKREAGKTKKPIRLEIEKKGTKSSAGSTGKKTRQTKSKAKK